MNLNVEVGLGLMVLAMYLKDSLLLLAPDEAVLEHTGRGGWQARFGWRRWTLAGREPCLPNPFTPQRPLYRLRWRMQAAAPYCSPPDQLAVAPELRRLAPFVWTAWLALFVVLPIGLFGPGGSIALLAAVCLLYANNLLALGLVYRWRDRLGLSRRQVLLTAFELLVCPPYSVNLVRRLCALRPSAPPCRAGRRCGS